MSIFGRKREKSTQTDDYQHLQMVHSEPQQSQQIVTDTSLIPDGYERLLLSHILSGGSVLEAVRDALLRSSDRLHQERLALETLNRKNDTARKSMEDLSSQIQQITVNSQDLLSAIEQLRLSLGNIQQCVADINRVSRQTDLLAINSAIEAAHVGIEGRGFTVIAKEIKMLSSEVQQQSAGIVALTEGIALHTQQLCEDIAAQVPLVEQMQTNVREAEELLNQVILRSSRMQSIIHLVSTQQFLNTVKMDHVIWKYQIYRYLMDNNQQATVNTHTECRLGKWFYGDEGAQYAAYPSFAGLEQPHARVHSSGREALEACFAHDYKKMEQALERMESASHNVVSVIDMLMSQISDTLLGRNDFDA